jgi:hypothetical protein
MERRLPPRRHHHHLAVTASHTLLLWPTMTMTKPALTMAGKDQTGETAPPGRILAEEHSATGREDSAAVAAYSA